MSLLDHFGPPLSRTRHWHSFHNAWATFIASELNRVLPPGYFAEPNVQFGVEIDVAAFEGGNGGAAGGWRPPAPTLAVPMTLLTDVAEVRVYSEEAGPVLTAAIELVSPSNKDRPESRQAFVSKCAAYLQEGLGLAVVDIVTARPANLHDLLMQRLEAEDPTRHHLYACAYRSVERDARPMLEVWAEPLSVGGPLPLLPLWMRGHVCVPLDLQASYRRTCEEQRIPPAA